jgi:drug/metabolite transporter (DMT)-like permease
MPSKDGNVLLHVGMLLLLSALIGGMFPLVKIAEQSITPLTLAMSRAILAALVLLFIVGVVMKRNLAHVKRTPGLMTSWKGYGVSARASPTNWIVATTCQSAWTCSIPVARQSIAVPR